MKKKMLLIARFEFVFAMIIYLSNVGTSFAQEWLVESSVWRCINPQVEPETLTLSRTAWFGLIGHLADMQIVLRMEKRVPGRLRHLETNRDFKMGYSNCFVSSLSFCRNLGSVPGKRFL
jgi:hypothetical protein